MDAPVNYRIKYAKEHLDYLIDHQADLFEWEKNFVNSMKFKYYKLWSLTSTQYNKLKEVHETVKARNGQNART